MRLSVVFVAASLFFTGNLVGFPRCQEFYSQVKEDEVIEINGRRLRPSFIHYEDWSLEKGFGRNARKDPDRIEVKEDSAERGIPGYYFESLGFRTCHTVLLKNRRTQQKAFLHAFDHHLSSRQREILLSFPAEDTDIVLVGNSGSPFLTLSAQGFARMGYSQVKTIRFNEKGSWGIIYRPDEDEIIYNNYDLAHTARIRRVFSSIDSD